MRAAFRENRLWRAFEGRLGRLLPKGQFARSVSIIAGGSAAAQIISLVLSPVITRLYSPKEMGVFSVFTSILMILSAVASLRYDRAIPVPKHSEEAVRVVVVSLALLPLTAVFISLLIILAGQPIAALMKLSSFARYFWLLPIGLICLGIYQALNYWCLRERLYSVIARTKFTQAFSQSAIQIGGGIAFGSIWCLFIGYVIGQSAGAGAFIRHFRLRVSKQLRAIRFSDLISTAKRYKRFPLLTSWSQIINAAGQQLPILMLASLYSPQVAGWYALGHRVLALPVSMISNSVSQVYLAEASRLMHEAPKALPRHFLRISSKLLLFAIPITLIGITSPWLCPLIFGRAWYQAGIYAAIMALPLCISVIAATTTNLISYGYNLWQSTWEVVRLVMIGGAIWGCSFFKATDIQAIVALAVTSSLAYLALYLLNWIAVRHISLFGIPAHLKTGSNLT